MCRSALERRLASNRSVTISALNIAAGNSDAIRCVARVRAWECDGVILGYGARIDPRALGRRFEVLVNVDLTREDRATFEAFEAVVAALDEVTEARRIFGLPDYVLRVATDSIESYAEFVSARPGDAPGLAQLDAHITMKLIKAQNRPGSLPAA